MRSRLAALACAAVACILLAGACNRAPSLTDLSSIEQLKTRFNADAGRPRIILLLSPT